MQDFETLGAFYLGRRVQPSGEDLESGNEELVLYDSKDLTTHAVCVGMTGSGKTGLCLSLLEEAALDNVPVLAIDPKGDLGNLLLAFPKLRSEDFLPWVEEGEATRRGISKEEHATATAELWKSGLAKWGQDGKRIQNYVDSTDISIYTPGSQAGLPLTVLRSFDAPPPAMRNDFDALTERVTATVSGLLALLGIEADPLQSQEHVFLSQVLSRAWHAGKNLTVADLIREAQAPSFDKVGVLDLDAFFPAKNRAALAMRLNGMLASPAFAAWMHGEPLDIQRLLWTPEGKPRISILSIAHLSDAQRMFFVTTLLSELVTWMRGQPGTSSLRAILYMDEVFGYFPPVANPPSKQPMLTLLKQARAYGVGCVLATQNPVDLDYKGLSNTGTWFLGRLQTERDKMRVLEGLEGASVASGSTFDRSSVDKILSGLGKRTFLLHNVHDREPLIFRTRWAMSYLRGPITRSQIGLLMADRKAAAATIAEKPSAAARVAERSTAEGENNAAPIPPDNVEVRYLDARLELADGEHLVYKPALIGEAKLHYVASKHDLDSWVDVVMTAPIDEDEGRDPWTDSETIPKVPSLRSRGEESATWLDLPKAARSARTWKSWGTRLRDHLYQEKTAELLHSPLLKLTADPGETEGDFRARIRHQVRETRDLHIEKLRAKFEPKLERFETKLHKAQQKIDREQEQAQSSSLDAAVSVGTSILGAIFGRRKVTATRTASAVRRASKVRKERGDVARAKDSMREVQQDLRDLEADFEAEVQELRDSYDVHTLELETVDVRPRKSDIDVTSVTLLWTPFAQGSKGSRPLD